MTEKFKMMKNDQVKELQELSEPLIKWLNKNGNPHMKLIIETDGFELLSGVCANRTFEFIPD